MNTETNMPEFSAVDRLQAVENNVYVNGIRDWKAAGESLRFATARALLAFLALNPTETPKAAAKHLNTVAADAGYDATVGTVSNYKSKVRTHLEKNPDVLTGYRAEMGEPLQMTVEHFDTVLNAQTAALVEAVVWETKKAPKADKADKAEPAAAEPAAAAAAQTGDGAGEPADAFASVEAAAADIAKALAFIAAAAFAEPNGVAHMRLANIRAYCERVDAEITRMAAQAAKAKSAKAKDTARRDAKRAVDAALADAQALAA